MYLSNKQHSQLRTLVMNFEIPYRAFVAMEILKKYPTDIEFENAIVSKSSLSSVYASFSTFSSEFGKIKANAKYIYSLLKNVKNSIGQSVQKDEINIPFISQINIFETFNDLNIRDEEFYQCVSYMGRNYLEIYKETHAVTYLRQARKMSDILFNERHKYNSKVRGFASGLRNELKRYIPTLR